MKLKDKETLAKNRAKLVRTIDASAILPTMMGERAFDSKDYAFITGDSRKSQQTARMLDVLEKKPATSYEIFLEVLEEHYPHVYLTLIDWEQDEDNLESEHLQDEWAIIRKTRKFLAEEIDASEIMPMLRARNLLDTVDEDAIRSEPSKDRRTECLLDVLETKENAYEEFIDVLSEVYPHIYLMLTDTDELNLDD